MTLQLERPHMQSKTPVSLKPELIFSGHEEQGVVGIRYLGGIALFNPTVPVSSRIRDCTSRGMLGWSEDEIGEDLQIAKRTVHEYLHRSFQYFGVDSKAGFLEAFVDAPSPVMYITKPIEPARVSYKITLKERAVMQAVAHGMRNQGIAEATGVPINTVKSMLLRLSRSVGDERCSRERIAAAAVLGGITEQRAAPSVITAALHDHYNLPLAEAA